MARSTKPPRTGAGVLTIGREAHPVSFEIRYVEAVGRKSARGGVTGDADAMRRAFREGYARLALDDGHEIPVTIVAHAEGAQTAFFESVGG